MATNPKVSLFHLCITVSSEFEGVSTSQLVNQEVTFGLNYAERAKVQQ